MRRNSGPRGGPRPSGLRASGFGRGGPLPPAPDPGVGPFASGLRPKISQGFRGLIRAKPLICSEPHLNPEQNT